MPDLPAPDGKFFPRNLTARADYRVPGNPSGTRAESGVDNCFPGLEFDQRNLDTGFFPGIRVDFHRDEGARVLAFTGEPALAQGLTDADLSDTRPLYVRALCGRTTVDQSEQQVPTVDCAPLSGLDVWRHVHDLLPGTVTVLLAPIATPPPAVPDLNGTRLTGNSFVQRDAQGRVESAVLTAPRARYLDADGVIDPEVYRPGELTRSLCAPWQYDFRDCGCFYWAASKPDVTSSADGSVPEVNFLRADRGTPPAPDLSSDQGGRRTALEFTYPQLIRDWQVLPVVLDDREQEEPVSTPRAMPAAVAAARDLMSPEDVAKELTKLAGVEHALCVEYLYAHYSLNAPQFLPRSADELTRRAHAAGQEVFAVAIDEMRHLRWVNEALAMLGRQPVLDRATVIDREIDHEFGLERLTRDRLQWFVDVEAPSRHVADDPDDPVGLDGMYVKLHMSVVQQLDLFPQGDRLAHLIKLIIDEGGDHYRRFLAVQDHLAGLQENQYLRRLDAQADAAETELLDISDQYYVLLLGTLRASLELFDSAGGALMAQTRLVMTNLQELHHVLAGRGVGPRFTMPVLPDQDGGTPAEMSTAYRQLARDAAATVTATLPAVARRDGRLRPMVLRHMTDVEAVLAALTALDGR
ncbi:ferritin-like domain-containing protein [Streptomyces sp. P17]|uniref:ferritin-like domain-containing protein n=1 Tax=Streptomyces sp. P17 TaxID=3074716 RepID=UPI0028F3F211|nr:ferritin-like domain-containing protein [Streptomyces sp. P17]MDT9698413.1 ferritin-like domain-containing protein [Streptomyces sp. P17]